jgi:ankyrin repeat protein
MGDEIGVELDDIAADVDYKPSEKESKRANKETKVRYEDRFESILTDWYDDKKNWWDAVEDCIKKDGDFSTRIASKSQEDGEKPRRRAIVEVMVDLLLEMEDISKDKALVYVSEEGLSEYPLEFMLKELLRRGADPNKGTGCSGESILHMAVAEENLEVIQLLLEKGAHVNKEDSYGSTPLSDALYISSYEITHLLIMYGADLPVDQKDKMAYMHLALRNGGEELIILLLKQGLSVDNEDKNGWTLLHYAGYYGCEKSAKVLISKGANINATDAYKQTPLHIAAKLGEENIVRCLLNHHADTGVVDYEGNRPLDLAAEEEFSDTFQIFVEHFSPTKHDKMHRKLVKKLMEAKRVKDEIVAEKLNEMSPFEVINMMKPKSCGGDYNFIKDFVRVKTLKKSTRAVMDHFVLGQRRVNCEIIDADDQGIPPDNGKFNAATPSLLDVIVETGNQELASHPAIRAIVDYKWKKFVRWIFLLSCAMYIVRMLLFTAALFIAARPDLDNPGCYRNGWDTLRIVLEALSLIWFLFKAFFQCFKLWL